MLNILLLLVANTLVVLLAYWRGYLTVNAALAATITGAVILCTAGIAVGSSVAVCFFVTELMSRHRDKLEGNRGNDRQARRNLGQVLANSALLVIIAIAIWLDGGLIWLAAFLGCLGAVAGDTWATEMARFADQQPRLITSWKKVPVGTPGAITVYGCFLTMAAGIVATAVYHLVAILLMEQPTLMPIDTLGLLVAGSVGALLGSTADSILGAKFQAVYQRADGTLTDHADNSVVQSITYQRGWRWLNNNGVNFASSVVGAISAALIAMLWFRG